MKTAIRIVGISFAIFWVLSLIVTEGGQAEPVVTAKYSEWQDKKRNRSIPVKFYIPKDDAHSSKPYPVVIFSHGLGGSREAAVYLGDYLCRNGYLGVFIQHPGSDESFWRPEIEKQGGKIDRAQLMQKFKTTVANPMHAVHRAQDVHFVIDMLETINKSDPLLHGKIDLSKMAIAGHSYGSWTALTASGQRLVTKTGREISSPDKRLKAAIYLSPTPPRKGADPAMVYGKIQIPGLHFTGTKDNSPVNSTKAEDRRIAFDNISKSDQYLIILDGADHMVFGGRARGKVIPLDSKHQEIVKLTSLRFLDAYLKGDEEAKAWLNAQAPTYLKPYGTYELKAAK